MAADGEEQISDQEKVDFTLNVTELLFCTYRILRENL